MAHDLAEYRIQVSTSTPGWLLHPLQAWIHALHRPTGKSNIGVWLADFAGHRLVLWNTGLAMDQRMPKEETNTSSSEQEILNQCTPT